MGQYGMDKGIVALDADIHHALPHILGNIGEKRLLGYACVVYQHIRSAAVKYP